MREALCSELYWSFGIYARDQDNLPCPGEINAKASGICLVRAYCSETLCFLTKTHQEDASLQFLLLLLLTVLQNTLVRALTLSYLHERQFKYIFFGK